MARRTEGRLLRLEQSVGAAARQGWNAIDLADLARRICREFSVTEPDLEKLLSQSDEDDYPIPAVEAYWVGFGSQIRSAGLTFVDLVNLADQEVA